MRLGDERLMAGACTVPEIAMAARGIASIDGEALSVVVGRPGLGYTAWAALDHPRVRDLIVVEFLQPLIEWRQQGILAKRTRRAVDARCRLVDGDPSAFSDSDVGFDPASPGGFEAIVADIDHSPRAWLDGRSGDVFQEEGLRWLMQHLTPGCVLGLWSNDPPGPAFTDLLATVFCEAWAEEVWFPNPYQKRDENQSTYSVKDEPRDRTPHPS